MPRVWDESCEKKRERELYWWYKIYPHDEIQNLLFLVLTLFRIVVVQEGQRNLQKSVGHEQSCSLFTIPVADKVS